MISRAGSSFAAFPSFDVSAVSALAPGETGSVAPASPILPCRGCELSNRELQPGVAYQYASSRRSASASRPRDRRIARRGTLGDFTRVGTPRAVRYRARDAGTAVRTGFAGHSEHLPRRVHWSFTPGKQLIGTDQSQPSQARIDLLRAAKATTTFFSIQPPRHTTDAQRSGETQHARVGFEHTRRTQRRRVESTFHEPTEVAREARLPQLEGEESGHRATRARVSEEPCSP